MSSIMPYTFPETGTPVRVVTINEEPWWLAGDVCTALDITNVGNALARLDEDEKSSIRLTDGTPGNPNRAVINEPGLYSLILRSDRPDARAFKRWITHEVIPSIRRTGSYGVPASRFEVPASFAEALELAARQARELETASARVAELEPVAHSWQVLAAGHGDFSVSDAAKILCRDPGITTGRNRLFTVLGELKWTYRQLADGKPRALQYAVERGWLSEIPQSHYHPRTGELVLDAPQLRVTVKGVHELHKRLGGMAPVQLPFAAVEGGAR
ncbi:BRO family protein [Streptomyces purpureus]|uniref:BRO family protein n=1 Tax=Streptomyces purpureus TaxID=1951 RepID=UPI003794F8E6